MRFLIGFPVIVVGWVVYGALGHEMHWPTFGMCMTVWLFTVIMDAIFDGRSAP